MKIKYVNNQIELLEEDARDKIFLEQCLNIKSGKLFLTVGKKEGKWEDFHKITISKFQPEYMKNYNE